MAHFEMRKYNTNQMTQFLEKLILSHLDLQKIQVFLCNIRKVNRKITTNIILFLIMP